MKIGVNARFLTKPFTGIGQYTKNLFLELSKIDKKNEYIFIVPEKIDSSIEKAFGKNVKIKIIPELKVGISGIKKTWWEQISVPEFFISENIDIAFFPYPSNPWTKDWYKKGIKTVLVIHDCIPWIKKNYRKGLMSKMYHAQTLKSANLADVILTVSESSKKDIEKSCYVDGRKIHVVYNDASNSYKQSPPLKKSLEVLKKFSLTKNRYFLYVGGYDERKNVDILKSEYSKFANNCEEVFPLVLAGGKLFENKLYGSFDVKTSGSIIKTGFLEDSHLNVLYRNCAAFVNISGYEGFNIPILEASNCGAPIILSDISVHKEIASKSAVFVDPYLKGDLSKAFSYILDEKNHKSFSEKSFNLSKKYSWSLSAQKVLDVLFSCKN